VPGSPTILEAPGRWPSPGLRELWRYRELLYFLAWRDVAIRYKQAVLGFGWAIVQPVASMLVFTVILGRVAGLPSEGLPYALLALSGLLPWQLFANSVQRASTSLVSNASLLTKVYLPRLAIPTAAIGAAFVDFAVAFGVLVTLMATYAVAPGAALVWLPAFLLLLVATALAIGLWLSALNAQYRDVGQAIPFLVNLGMWLSPVAYSAEVVPEGPWRWLYGLNPMTCVIQGFRWTLLGSAPPDALAVALSSAIVALLLAAGLLYFRSVETRLADVI
jgi:lipopolysaccharide transport system permease protein